MAKNTSIRESIPRNSADDNGADLFVPFKMVKPYPNEVIRSENVLN